jgi:ubiquinone/menaquinone biosynthesis C-methylase UbiE
MKQAELDHPRIFDDKEWAEGYYKRNKWSISRVGKDFAAILKKSGFAEGRILDVGCGFAAVPVEIGKVFPGAEIIGIDLAKPLLEIGRKLVDETGLADRIKLVEGNCHELAFENDSFDVVINTFLVHIVEHPGKMLNEMERVAKPEGKVMIRDLRRGFLARIVHKFRKGYTAREAAEVLGKSQIRPGRLSNGPFWWDYITAV